MCGDQLMGNRLSGLYDNRIGMATEAKNMLGTAKSGIRMIGQANTFANKIGVSCPAMNNMSNALQQLASSDVA